MRKLVTLISAMALLVGLVAVPAVADDTLAELEQAVADAEAEVAFWEDEVDRLEGALLLAKQVLAAAEEDRDAAQAAVDAAQDDVDDAQAELDAAVLVRDQIQAQYEGCSSLETSALMAQCRAALVASLNNANDAVDDAQTELEAAQDVLDEATEELADAQTAVEAAQDDVDALEDELQDALDSLEAAEQALADAEAALEDYLAQQERHPGCNGIEVAHAEVSVKTAGKGNSKAAATLTNLARGFNCDV
jgi:chromosome segregation ATPase